MTQRPADSDSERPGVQRRTVLRGVALTGAVGASGSLLAACGGGSEGNAGGSSGGSGSGSADGGGGGGGQVLAQASEIPVGSGTVFPDEEVVVTQPSKGDFKAFTAVCTHQGCIVAEVDQDTINCHCHGSMYDNRTGEVVAGPAPQPLAEKQITVEQGTISLA